MSEPTTDGVSTWDAPAPVPGKLLIPFGLALLIIVLVAVAVGAVTSAVVGVLMGVLLTLLWLWWVSSRGRAALRSLDARPAGEGDARLMNLVDGLAGDLHVRALKVWVIDSAGPNAFVTWARGPHLAVTAGLVTGYTRTELEAVVAHCLVRLATGDARRAAQAVALGPLAGKTVPEGTVQDLQTVSVTRYPPALASAIRKAEPEGGRFGLLWFVGSSESHVPQEDRASALLDL